MNVCSISRASTPGGGVYDASRPSVTRCLFFNDTGISSRVRYPATTRFFFAGSVVVVVTIRKASISLLFTHGIRPSRPIPLCSSRAITSVKCILFVLQSLYDRVELGIEIESFCIQRRDCDDKDVIRSARIVQPTPARQHLEPDRRDFRPDRIEIL